MGNIIVESYFSLSLWGEMRKALLLILYFVSNSVAFPSAFGSLSFLSRLDQEEYDAWAANCGVSDVERYLMRLSNGLKTKYSVANILDGSLPSTIKLRKGKALQIS